MSNCSMCVMGEWDKECECWNCPPMAHGHEDVKPDDGVCKFFKEIK